MKNLIGTALALFAGLCIVTHCVGCMPGKTPDPRRETARAAILGAAEAAVMLDQACASIVVAMAEEDLKKAKDIGERCDAVYNAARISLATAAMAIDAWEQADKGRAICAVTQTTDGLIILSHELQIGGRALATLEDATALVKLLGPCRGST